jgi:hypothetical protein
MSCSLAYALLTLCSFVQRGRGAWGAASIPRESYAAAEALAPVLSGVLPELPKVLCRIVASYAEQRPMTWSRAGERAGNFGIEQEADHKAQSVRVAGRHCQIAGGWRVGLSLQRAVRRSDAKPIRTIAHLRSDCRGCGRPRSLRMSRGRLWTGRVMLCRKPDFDGYRPQCC